MNDLTDLMAVTVPEGKQGSMRVQRFTVTGDTFTDFQYRMQGRGCAPGEYTMLRDGPTIWMSDTTAERRDHLEPVRQIRLLKAERVLINGLGLGMVVQAALSFDHVREIDVVERDARVIALVGAHYTRDGRVAIYHADAYEQARRWPKDTHWDVAWHDIWPEICSDNIPEMTQLHRSYARRTTWQGSWAQRACRRLRQREAAGLWL